MTTKELLTTEEFRKELEININTYNNRPLPKKGQYYRRTPYDELKQRHMFNVEELRKEVRAHTRKGKQPFLQPASSSDGHRT
ncbi:MAG: hypothetical protein IKZ87_02900 [Actinomycetaceae bacterium]|nr:hypothetical protein [Actinomycetaceae bacterium]